MIAVVAISYCWWHKVHPDPCGKQLVIIRQAVKLRLAVEGPGGVVDAAMFLDYCSITQKAEHGDPRNPQEGAERTPEELETFKAGLGTVNIVYGNQMTETWILNWVPLGMGFQYDERGWPTFEKLVSSLIKDPVKLVVLTEHTTQCQKWQDILRQPVMRSAPITPQKFEEIIASKHITSGKDRDFLKEKYADTFAEVISSAETLWFVSLGWDDDAAQDLTNIFPFCSKLEEIILGYNEISEEGALRLAMAADTCPSLIRMDLTHNDKIKPRHYGEIEMAWQAAGKQPQDLLLTEDAASKLPCAPAAFRRRTLRRQGDGTPPMFELELQAFAGPQPGQQPLLRW